MRHSGLLLSHALGPELLRQLAQAVSARGLAQRYESAEEDCDTSQDLRWASFSEQGASSQAIGHTDAWQISERGCY